MPLPPSRKDPTPPPKPGPGRDASNLFRLIQHHGAYLTRLDPGLQGGRFYGLRPLKGGMPQLVDTSGIGGGGDDVETAWEMHDLHTVAATGTQRAYLTYEPIEDSSLFVRWHPDGGGGVPVVTPDFTISGQLVTIPDPGYFAVGDLFTFQYEYVIGEDVPEPTVVGVTAPGVWDASAHTMTYAVPPGVTAGDYFLLSVRGSVAPGGGELNDGLSCPDPRMSLLFQATAVHGGQTVIESIWGGFATGSGTPVVVNVADSTYPTAQARGVLAALRGVNGVSSVTAVETGTTTPVAAGIAALAVVWARGAVVVNATPPTGYTDIGSSGSDYYSTDVSWWYDPDASSSPTGTFTGEGCCIIGLT